MNEQVFYQAIQNKSNQLGINPLLLLSGIEGLYTFRDVPLNTINYEFLDSLILSIFALRIGDSFHNIASDNLTSTIETVRQAAHVEMAELTSTEIENSGNDYLRSFAGILAGKSIIRKYHEKALEVAAIEIKKAQIIFGNNSISTIILYITKNDESGALNIANFV
ncbi:MAG TPA: hypothetical protein VM888_10420 [Chitinophagaceae bacterium]|jgi:hypothetical protein|nr:hypothetical protein [Chitinophagaceae bacterium]